MVMINPFRRPGVVLCDDPACKHPMFDEHGRPTHQAWRRDSAFPTPCGCERCYWAKEAWFCVLLGG
jgi:hypothetical protein